MKTWLPILALLIVALPAADGQEGAVATRVRREARLNSAAWESNIALTANRLTIYFSTRRGGQKWNQEDSDIYYAVRLDTAAPWSEAIPLPLPINDELDQDEVHISPDGRLLTYQRWSNDWRMEGGPYYQMEWTGNREWKGNQPLGGGITEFFEQTANRATDGMTRLPDGSIIFAAGPASDGPMDLYYSEFGGARGFLLPKRLECNTEFDERSVFLAADGQTIYFASNRPGGLGGLDIYRMTLREDGTMTPPENIGAPINSRENDSGLVIYSPSEAYFIRDQDIYRVENPGFRMAPVRPVEDTPAYPTPVGPPPCAGAPPTPPKWVEVAPPQPAATRPAPARSIPDGPIAAPGPQLKPEPNYVPNNAVFLLDVSSSMNEKTKLPLMVSAIRGALQRFYRRDKISIITFSSTPTVVLNGVEGDQRATIQYSLTGLKTRGGTEGKPALEEALACAEAHFLPNGRNVVIWATDAKLKLRELKPLARRLKRKNIDLVMFIYGQPDPEVEKDVKRHTDIADGRYQWVQQNNINAALEEVLQLKPRQQ